MATFTNTDHGPRQWYTIMTQGSEGTPGEEEGEWVFPPRLPFSTLELEAGEETVDPVTADDQTPLPDDFEDPWLKVAAAPPPPGEEEVPPPPPPAPEAEAPTHRRTNA
jgi:hypothetical protein